MARDSQRSKVYRAQREAFGNGSEGLGVEEAQALLDKWASSAYLRKRYPKANRPVEVRDGRGYRRAVYAPSYCPSINGWRGASRDVIQLPKWARSRWILAHEFAHHLVGLRDGAWHDWAFCEAYLYVVRVFLGRHDEEKLKAAFKTHKVRFRPVRKRQMTDEQRQAARERMLAMHAERRATPVS